MYGCASGAVSTGSEGAGVSTVCTGSVWRGDSFGSPDFTGVSAVGTAAFFATILMIFFFSVVRLV
jgi:hypothetical protein